MGCPIRRSPDRSLLAAPRGFSQRATSFVASRRQGIHQMPFSRSPRPGGSTTGTARRIPMPDAGRPPRRAAAGARQSARPPRTEAREGRLARRHHTMGKGTTGAADAAPRGTARPEGAGGPGTGDRRPPPGGVVGPGRLERPTSRLSGVRSDRLSYGPAPGAPRKGRRGGLGEGTGGRRGRLVAPRGARARAGTLERR